MYFSPERLTYGLPLYHGDREAHCRKFRAYRQSLQFTVVARGTTFRTGVAVARTTFRGVGVARGVGLQTTREGGIGLPCASSVVITIPEVQVPCCPTPACVG